MAECCSFTEIPIYINIKYIPERTSEASVSVRILCSETTEEKQEIHKKDIEESLSEMAAKDSKTDTVRVTEQLT